MSKILLPGIRNKHKRVTPTIRGAEEKKPQNLHPPPSPVNNTFNREVYEIEVKLANAEQVISLLVKDYNDFVNDNDLTNKITIDDITKNKDPPVLLSNEYRDLSQPEKKRYNDIQKEIKDAKIEWDKLQTQLDAHNTNMVLPPSPLGEKPFPPPPPPISSGIRTKKRKRKQKSKKKKSKKKKSKKRKSKKKGKSKKKRKTSYKKRRTRSK